MRSTRLLLSCVVLFALSIFAAGQAGTGAITGVVTDPSGAVVQGANVTATNTATGATRTVVSSDSGNYNLTSLAPGRHGQRGKNRLPKNGLRERSGFQLIVSSSECAIPAGDETESVNVTTDTLAPIETEDSQISNLVDSARMRALPLITRNPYELVLLSPGTASANSSLGGFNVNGERERNNNFLLDGVDNNDTSVPGIPAARWLRIRNRQKSSASSPTTSMRNMDATPARSLTWLLRAAPTSFTAMLYWFGRYEKIGGARDWFNRPQDGPINPYDRNQFGYSIGGPIWKNKTFFFFNHELQRFRTSLTNAAVVPTQDFRNGIFTFNGVDDNGDPITRTIDLTQGSPDNQAATASYELFNGSSVPDLPPDPTMQHMFSLYPNPTTPTGDGYSGTVFFPNDSNQHSYQATGKLDHHFTGHRDPERAVRIQRLQRPEPVFQRCPTGQCWSHLEQSNCYRRSSEPDFNSASHTGE